MGSKSTQGWGCGAECVAHSELQTVLHCPCVRAKGPGDGGGGLHLPGLPLPQSGAPWCVWPSWGWRGLWGWLRGCMCCLSPVPLGRLGLASAHRHEALRLNPRPWEDGMSQAVAWLQWDMAPAPQASLWPLQGPGLLGLRALIGLC